MGIVDKIVKLVASAGKKASDKVRQDPEKAFLEAYNFTIEVVKRGLKKRPDSAAGTVIEVIVPDMAKHKIYLPDVANNMQEGGSSFLAKTAVVLLAGAVVYIIFFEGEAGREVEQALHTPLGHGLPFLLMALVARVVQKMQLAPGTAAGMVARVTDPRPPDHPDDDDDDGGDGPGGGGPSNSPDT